MFGYVKEIETGNVVDYWDLAIKPNDTDELQFIECDESDKPELYKEELVCYCPDELISWALGQNFATAIMAHMAAFLDFANKASVTSEANFLAYAGAVGLTDTANIIINKAIELGADLGGV